MSRLLLRLAPVVILLFVTIACGGGNASPSPVSPSPTSPSPTSPAPVALQGAWVTTLTGSGERVTLTLSATGYQISRGANQAVGAIAVSGDRIDFSRSSVCNGAGAYRWAITGSSLLFTTLVPDACPGRSEVLDGYTYSKSG